MSDEIPVGSPPAPPGRHAAPGGWYADPVDPARERYWDGWQWSRQTRVSEAPTKKHRPRPVASRPHGQAGPSGPPGQPDHSGPSTPRGPGALAGWWHRAGAAALDWLFVSIVTTAVLAPLYLRIGDRMEPVLREMFLEALAGRQPDQIRPEEMMSQQEQMIILLVSVILGLAYHAVFLKWRGATPGKMICGLKVVAAGAAEGEQDGGPLVWRQALTRAMVWVFPGQHTCLWPIRVIDIVLPVSDPRNRALHDRMAGTVVVRSR